MRPAAPSIHAAYSLSAVRRRLIASCCPSASSRPWSDSASASCGCSSSCWAKPALGFTAGLGLKLPLTLVGGFGGAAGATPAVSVSASAGATTGGGVGRHTGGVDGHVTERAPALGGTGLGEGCGLARLGQGE